MDERRRFAIALTGVAGSLGLAAVIALSGSTAAPLPPVMMMEASRAIAPPLPALALPDVAATPAVGLVSPQPQRQRERFESVAPIEPIGIAPAAWPEAVAFTPPAPTPATLAAMSRPVQLVAPPRATATSIAMASHTERRGAVTAAFVTAGSEVGAGFKTVGRTLKRLF